MESRTDIHRRTPLLYWLRVACMVGLSGLGSGQGSYQHTDRVIVSPNHWSSDSVIVQARFE